MAVRDARGKEIMIQGGTSIKDIYKTSRDDVAGKMEKNEVPEDILTFITAVQQMCR
ncbi:hypothetical protein D3C73_1621710 [compost metagenome]